MARYTLDGSEVRLIRDAHHGDRGYNPAKGTQVIIENPMESAAYFAIPIDRLVVLDDDGNPTATPQGIPEGMPTEGVLTPAGYVATPLSPADADDEAPEEEADEPDPSTATVAQLKAALDAAGVEYPSTATKPTLIELVEDNEVPLERQ